MTTYKLTMSYDGSFFAGFQRQSDASLVTVQGLLEQTIAELFGAPVHIHGAGRTDAGVHARAQVAHFSFARQIPAQRLCYALNRALPPALVIREAEVVDAAFHARKSAVGKWYSYRIFNAQTPPALGHGYFTHIPQPMDQALFRQALAQMVGAHNFEGFCGRGATVKTFERTLYLAKLCIDAENPAWWHIHFVGDGFLRKMVRNLVGTAVDIALGRRPLGCVQDALVTHNRSKAGPTAPADGLTMEEVFYEQTRLQACIATLAERPETVVVPLCGEDVYF
ncbi:MAG: tRNA pseudouridine(38-40) synthase TruA [Peptococcaceae bacterium]|nr:tRNA pseudouridine(38-40) synthase TruA [Peptococcaceae bacterium]